MNDDWHAAYWRDQRFPTGMDGKTYVKGRRPERADLTAAVRHLGKVQQATKLDIWAIIRLHRVETNRN